MGVMLPWRQESEHFLKIMQFYFMGHIHSRLKLTSLVILCSHVQSIVIMDDAQV
jgi:hypothetical protein